MMNTIELLVSPNRMIANGIHAADGRICRPVISGHQEADDGADDQGDPVADEGP
jgi:hypothetical protein